MFVPRPGEVRVTQAAPDPRWLKPFVYFLFLKDANNTIKDITIYSSKPACRDIVDYSDVDMVGALDFF